MPAPPHSHAIGVIVKGLDSSVLEGATVSVSLGSESLTNQTTNSAGEAIFNVGNFTSWSVGDEVSITASKTGVGTKTSTLILADTPGDKLTLQLAQTSELTYWDEETKHVLNFALLTDFEGNKITDTNPLPIKIVDSNGNRIKISQKEENRLGSECTGSDGANGRVLTLNNTSESGGPVSIWVEDQLIAQSDMTLSHLSASSTITFDNIEVFNTDTIKVLYYV